MSPYSRIALRTFKTPGVRRFGRSERKKDKVVAEYRSWAVQQLFSKPSKTSSGADEDMKVDSPDSMEVDMGATGVVEDGGSAVDGAVVDGEGGDVGQVYGDAHASPTEPALLVEGSRSGGGSGSHSAETPLAPKSATLGLEEDAMATKKRRATKQTKERTKTRYERRTTRRMTEEEQDRADEREVERMLLHEDAADDEDGNEVQDLRTGAMDPDVDMEVMRAADELLDQVNPLSVSFFVVCC